MKRSAFFIVWRRLYSIGTLSSWPCVISMKKPCTRLNSTRRFAIPVRSRSRFSMSSRNALQVVLDRAQLVEAGIVAVADHAAVAKDAAGSSFNVREERVDLVQRAQRLGGGEQARLPARHERVVQRRQRRERVAQPARSRGRALPSAMRAVMRSTSDQPRRSRAARDAAAARRVDQRGDHAWRSRSARCRAAGDAASGAGAGCPSRSRSGRGSRRAWATRRPRASR
jgi:hypothetical protein